MGFKKIQMETRGFQKMKLRFPSSAVYMENLRELVTNLWFGDKVSKIRDLKINVGAPEQVSNSHTMLGLCHAVFTDQGLFLDTF